MKKIIITLFFITVAYQQAFPLAFGVFARGGGGKVDMLRLHRDFDYSVSYSSVNAFYGGGIMLETGDGSEGYHNRLSLELEGASTFGGRYDYLRLMRTNIVNVFAFRIAGSENFRLWIGPLLGINLLSGFVETSRHEIWSKWKNNGLLLSLAGTPPSFQSFGLYYTFYERVWRRTYGVYIPVGAALGVNIRLGDSAAFMLEGGARCGLYILTKGGFNYEGYLNAGFLFGAI